MTIVEAFAALEPHYPTHGVCIECTVWRHGSGPGLEIKYSVWNGNSHFYGANLDRAVELAIQAVAPGNIPVTKAQEFCDEADRQIPQPA